MLRIGEVVLKIGISADTLRYYEKINLMPKVHRNNGGVRFYGESDLSRLRFIKRAQKMGFSLNEITQLLAFRENPQRAKPIVRDLAYQKLAKIEENIAELNILRDELRLLTTLCDSIPEGCPILDKLDNG